MEEMIRMAFSKYGTYVSEQRMYERWLDMRENPEVREALTVVNMKVTMIESWLNLLNADERFVVQKHLIDEIEWPRISFLFTEQWKGEFTRTERTLVAYQANALKKIIEYCEVHQRMVLMIFGDLPSCTNIVEKSPS